MAILHTHTHTCLSIYSKVRKYNNNKHKYIIYTINVPTFSIQLLSIPFLMWPAFWWRSGMFLWGMKHETWFTGLPMFTLKLFPTFSPSERLPPKGMVAFRGIYRSFHFGKDPTLEGATRRIIPFSKWLVTSMYNPFRPFGMGITLLRGLTIHGY